MAIKFGRQQSRNPTPASIIFWVRLGSAVAGGLQGWMLTAKWIPADFQIISGSILGFLIMLANTVTGFFGVPVKEGSDVPADKVTAIESDVKPQVI